MEIGTPSREVRLFLAAAASLVAGGALAFVLMPWVYRYAPTELSRITTVVDAAKSNDVPTVVVLGNSVVMNGVDGALLAKELRMPGPAWNLATTGQQLVEQLMLVDAMTAERRLVVLGVTADELMRPTPEMPLAKAVGFRMAGYRPSQAVLDGTAGMTGLAGQLGMADWKATLASRWVVRSTVDLWARGIIRKDLALERAQADLVFPSPYTQAVSPAALEHLIRANLSPRGQFAAGLGVEDQFALMARLAAARGNRLVVAVMPEHPAKAAMTGAGYFAQLTSFLGVLHNTHGLTTVDLHDVLDATDFVDHVHPGGAGSQKLTRLLAASLAHVGGGP